MYFPELSKSICQKKKKQCLIKVQQTKSSYYAASLDKSFELKKIPAIANLIQPFVLTLKSKKKQGQKSSINSEREFEKKERDRQNKYLSC